MSEAVMSANVKPENRARLVKVDGDNGFDRLASTKPGSNLSILIPIIFWLPVLALVLATTAVISIVHTIMKLVGYKFAPGRTADELKPLMQSLTIDELTKCKREELDNLFELGGSPTITEIKGLTEGRVLLGTFWPINLPLNLKFINLPYFPWKGKVFQPLTKDMGCGRNRMQIGPLKVWTFPFETLINPPLFGKNNVFTLNYTLEGNPWWSRMIRDDLVRLKDGLFLGRANIKWKGDHVFLVYFTLTLLNK